MVSPLPGGSQHMDGYKFDPWNPLRRIVRHFPQWAQSHFLTTTEIAGSGVI
jgi:hypothetical protein